MTTTHTPEEHAMITSTPMTWWTTAMESYAPQFTDTYYVSQLRTKGQENWSRIAVARTALEAAFSLGDGLQMHGVRGTDLHGVREDLAAGHLITLDNGMEFRVMPRQPIVNASAPMPTEGMDRCPCGAKYWDGPYCHSCGKLYAGPDFTMASTANGQSVNGVTDFAGSTCGTVKVWDADGELALSLEVADVFTTADALVKLLGGLAC